MANIIDGNVYELRPVSDPTRNMAIGASSHVDGAKAILYPTMDINDQKWRFTWNSSSSGWQIANVESGKGAVVWWPTSANPFVEGQQIVQWWGDQSGENAVWTAYPVGNTTVGGVECPVVVFECTAHPTVSISVSDAIEYGSNLVKLATTDTAAQTQQWICVPTLVKGSMPAPNSLGMSASSGSFDPAIDSRAVNPNNGGLRGVEFSGYPHWSVPASYANDAVFLYRSRTLLLYAPTGRWIEETWSSWAEPAVTRRDNTFWLDTTMTSNPNSTRKLSQSQFEVRMVDADGAAGQSAHFEYTWYQRPEISWGTASWTPDGLTISADSSYSKAYTSGSVSFIKGPTYIYIDSLTIGGTEYMAGTSESLLVTNDDDVFVPQSMLLGIPPNEGSMNITYSVGTDKRRTFDNVFTKSNVQVSYDEGSPSVTVTGTDGFTKTVAVADSDDTRVWILYNGEIIECPNGVVAYPFGEPYDIFALGTYGQSDPKTPFAWYEHYTGTAHGVHAWNWDGGSASLQVREGEPIIVDDSIEAVYESFDLAARPYETVSFAETRHHKFTAEGAVIEGKTVSERTDFELVAGIHATYRSPRGDVVPVAILSVSRESHKNWTEIDVTMVRESE